jgi:hypothetical protein
MVLNRSGHVTIPGRLWTLLLPKASLCHVVMWNIWSREDLSTECALQCTSICSKFSLSCSIPDSWSFEIREEQWQVYMCVCVCVCVCVCACVCVYTHTAEPCDLNKTLVVNPKQRHLTAFEYKWHFLKHTTATVDTRYIHSFVDKTTVENHPWRYVETCVTDRCRFASCQMGYTL